MDLTKKPTDAPFLRPSLAPPSPAPSSAPSLRLPPPTQAPEPEPSEKKVDIAVIVGASVGGVASIILIILVFLRRRSGKIIEEEEGIAETKAPPSTSKNIAEILVEPQDDVSTLGDPMFGHGGMMMGSMDKDEMTAT